MLAGTESDEATRAASELHAAIISTSNVEAPSTSFHPTVTSYNVQVSYHGEQWLVAKRYSEFDELRAALEQAYVPRVIPKEAWPAFPQKHILGNFVQSILNFLFLPCFCKFCLYFINFHLSRFNYFVHAHCE